MDNIDDVVILEQAIVETLYLNQIPGMVDSINGAANEPLDKGVCLQDLDW